MTAAWIAVDWGIVEPARLGDRRRRRGRSPKAPPPTGAIDARARRLRAGAARASSTPWLAPDARTDVIVCGMAGARGAWAEARLRHGPLPARRPPPSPAPPTARPAARRPHPARPPPGRARPTSCAARRPRSPASSPPSPASTASPACPAPTPSGSHVAAGEVVSFASYMTGEIFALLAGASVLRKTVATDGWSEPDFLAGRRGRPRPPRARAGAPLRRCAPRRCCTASPPSAPAPGSRAC